MDLNNFELEDLLLSAIKSEEETSKFYKKLKKKTKNGLLQDKLKFLAKEEEKHKAFIEEIYLNHFPDKKINLPLQTPVPLPKIKITKETSLSIIFVEAMNAEEKDLKKVVKSIIRFFIFQIWKLVTTKF